MATHGKMSAFDATKESWTSYAERLSFYFKANRIVGGEAQKAVFITVIGARTYGLLKSLLQPHSLQDDDVTLDLMRETLQKHFDPKPSPITQRFRFHTRMRKQDESVVAELRVIGEHCDFGDSLDAMIRDRLVCGINNSRIQRRLLQEADLNYERALQLAQAMELAAQDITSLSGKPEGKPQHVPAVQNLHHRKDSITRSKIECFRCGGDHFANKCRFIDSDCRSCGKKGHLARVCRSKDRSDKPQTTQTAQRNTPRGKHSSSKDLQTQKQHPTHNIDHHRPRPSSPGSDQDYPLFTLPSGDKPIVVTVYVNKTQVEMEVDTGASLSLMSESTYSSLSSSIPSLSPSNVTLTTYTGEKIVPVGTVDVDVTYQSQTVTLPLLIVPGNGPTLMGRNWLEHIQLNWSVIKNINCSFSSIDDVCKKHERVFRPELGKLQGFAAKLHIHTDAKPRFFRPRPIALSLKQKVLAEIDRLQGLGVITPVKYSEWAAPIVPIVKTDGSIRLCGDYKVTVNPVLLADTYPLPRPDDLFAALAGGKIFSKLDLKHAYLQVPLDETSKQYTTINTPKGLYQYERLPFGVSSAPSLFQRTMENLLSGLNRVSVYLDDILVTGINEADHLQNLHVVLQALEEAGLTLKKSKCQFAVPSVEYLGHIIDATGLHPSESKVEAIRKAPTPTNVTELKSFLGLLSYYRKFLPDLATLLAPLHELLRKDIKWKWTTDHEEAFQQVKSLLHSSSVLVHYDEKKPLIIACDASPYGLGAILSHQMDDGSDSPVAFASRTLSPAEKKYSQLEKEALAIIFAVRKFHDYVYGRKFILYSDHKPLQFLFSESKQIPTLASSRIQRWALALSAYNYSIQHKPGVQIPHADALSRLPLPNYPQSVPMPQDVVLMLNHISDFIVSANNIKEWTDSDPALSRLRRLVLSKGNMPDDATALKPYAHCFNELSVTEGCLLRGSRVIIPPQGRTRILSQLHETHQGTSRMKSLARCYIWWPGLDKEIEDTVRKCKECQEHSTFPPQTPIHPWECPSTPWTRLHVDHAGPFIGHYFLVLVDAHSRWLEVHQVPSTSTEATVKILRQIFATHGLPKQLVSDNGPAFTSQDFKTFMSQNGIRHSLTAPYHPRSNGMAERAVQTFKYAMKKMDGSLHDKLAQFLFQYRITPQTTTGRSPAEMLMGRRLRSVLDSAHPDTAQSTRNDKKRVRSFQMGEKLFARNYSGHPLWIPVVVSKITGPLSYRVETTDGITLKRHTDQLRRRYSDDAYSSMDGSIDEEDAFDAFPLTPPAPPLVPPPAPTTAPPLPPIRRSTRTRTPRDHGPFVC